jgi:hypothetical protein
LFGDDLFTAAEIKESSYPPLPLRRLYAEQLVATWGIETGWDTTLKTLAVEAMRQARKETQEAFVTILGPARRMVKFDKSVLRSGIKHLEYLQYYWNSTMVEKLRPYSYSF